MPRTLRRDAGRRVVAGLCSGVAGRFGVDPLLVRLGFLVATLAGGLGLGLYLLGWLVVPLREGAAPAPRRLAGGRGAVEMAGGAALLLLSVLLTFRELGLWFSDAVVWPLVLVTVGAALLWRQSASAPGATSEPETPAVKLSEPATQRSPSAPATGLRSVEEVRRRAALVSRTSLGVALVIAAGLVFLQATGALSVARDVVLAVLVAVVVLGVIFAPWVLRLVRSLTEERAERIRSQERAEMAAHLHDSVLQTLAMVQRRSDDPQAVAALSRRQERELRSWLSGRGGIAGQAPGHLAAALERAAEQIEEEHGVKVEVVTVGDAELDSAREALVAAAREAMLNAAKFAGGEVAVYAQAENGRAQVFVRDRGPGFDQATVPADRRGVRESIVGRMQRHGGSARITSAPGAGTEVELTLDGRGA